MVFPPQPTVGSSDSRFDGIDTTDRNEGTLKEAFLQTEQAAEQPGLLEIKLKLSSSKYPGSPRI